MKDKGIRSEIEKLKKDILRHDRLYYVEDSPVISDQEYDALMKHLRELEDAHPELVTPDSPTQRVGGEPTKGFPAVKHIVPMLSMDNTYSEEEMREFDERIRKNLKGASFEYVAELKIDGVSISILYKDGIFVRGATRSEGGKAVIALPRDERR